MSKIPDITPELEKLYASNTEALLILGGKEWKTYIIMSMLFL